MIKKVILISICLILLTSCGRKNELENEVSLNNNVIAFNIKNNILNEPWWINKKERSNILDKELYLFISTIN